MSNDLAKISIFSQKCLSRVVSADFIAYQFYGKINQSMRGKLNVKPYKSAGKIILVFVLSAVFIIALNVTGFSKNVKAFFFSVSSPIQKTFWQAGKNISDFTSGIFKVNTLKKEIEILTFENQELMGQIIAIFEIKKENEALREALGLGLEKEFNLILAQIISKDVSQDSVLIDRGLKDGIAEGMPVITGQKVLLGKIGQVYDRFSEVIFISNKESSFDAKVFKEEDEVFGIIKGTGRGGLYFDLIPKNKEIVENDIIVTSVLGGVYPAGLLVGEIEKINRSDRDPFQAAEIRPIFNIKDLNYLFILTEW